MIEIIGVRFKNGGKVYYFSPGSWKVKSGDLVITETARGTECGEVAIANKQIPKEQVTAPLKQILRHLAQNLTVKAGCNHLHFRRDRRILTGEVCMAAPGMDRK